jgi:hypothetical protein
MIEVLKHHPEGLTSGQWRVLLDIPPGEQAQLDRRKRELYLSYRIRRERRGAKTLYFYEGERETPLDPGPISLKLRARILHQAASRCGMCGRTVQKHGIALVVDHKVPREWGGKTAEENLWAICEDCNQGKQNFFASLDRGLMGKVMRHRSVHVRIGELLKAKAKEPVPSWLIGLVAGQADWMKRTRELRYLGWKIQVSKKKAGQKVESHYTLVKAARWPEDPTGWIRRFEQDRARRKRPDD